MQWSLDPSDYPLRLAYAVPRAPRKRFRARQLLWAVIHVDLAEPKPGLFVLNRYGVPIEFLDATEGQPRKGRVEPLI